MATRARVTQFQTGQPGLAGPCDPAQLSLGRTEPPPQPRVLRNTVSIYMVPRQDRPLQTWKTFLRNHMEGIASIDLFVVPTIAFEQLFAFLVLGHRRRQLLWIAVTRNPTAEWLTRRITEAVPWDSGPQYIVCYDDRAF